MTSVIQIQISFFVFHYGVESKLVCSVKKGSETNPHYTCLIKTHERKVADISNILYTKWFGKRPAWMVQMLHVCGPPSRICPHDNQTSHFEPYRSAPVPLYSRSPSVVPPVFLLSEEPFCQVCFGIRQFVHSVYILSQFLFILLFNPSSAYLFFVNVPSLVYIPLSVETKTFHAVCILILLHFCTDYIATPSVAQIV